MSEVGNACKRLISSYEATGMTPADAVEAAIDRTSHDIVFFRGTNPRLKGVAEKRLRWLQGYRQRMEGQ